MKQRRHQHHRAPARDPSPSERALIQEWVDLQFGKDEVSFKAVRGKGKWLLLLSPHTKRNADLSFVMVSDEDLECPIPPRGRRELDSPNRRRAIRRVHQLLRLAEGNANRNEARAAQTAARRIMREHQIAPTDLRTRFTRR